MVGSNQQYSFYSQLRKIQQASDGSTRGLRTRMMFGIPVLRHCNCGNIIVWLASMPRFLFIMFSSLDAAAVAYRVVVVVVLVVVVVVSALVAFAVVVVVR